MIYRNIEDLFISELKEIVKANCAPDFDYMASDKIAIKNSYGVTFSSTLIISECDGFGSITSPICVDEPQLLISYYVI